MKISPVAWIVVLVFAAVLGIGLLGGGLIGAFIGGERWEEVPQGKLGALLFASPFKAEAQGPARLTFGSRVRVLTSNYILQGKVLTGKYELLTGQVLAMTSDTLIIRDDHRNTIHFPLASVTR